MCGSVLLAAGCGGHAGKETEPSAGSSRKSASAQAAAPGAKGVRPLTRAQLEQAALKNGDADGWEVSVPKSADGPLGGQRMTADKAACQPVADALSQTGKFKPVASVERTAVAKDRSGLDVRVRLASYSVTDAEKIMAGLADASSGCKSFTGSSGGTKDHIQVGPYDSYLSSQSSIGLWLVTRVGTQVLPVYLDVGMVDGTLEYFMTFNVTGDDPKTGSTTAEIQQSVKLAAAGH